MSGCRGEKLIHFVYVSFLEGSDKFYIGKHSCTGKFCNYNGSGSWIKKCKGNGGIFKTEVVWEFSNPELAIEYEVELINKMKALYPNRCMNFCLTKVPSVFGRKNGEETRAKLSKANKGKKLSEETKRKIGKHTKIRNLTYRHSEEAKKKIGNLKRGLVASEETRAKMVETRKKFRRWVVCLKTGMTFHGTAECAKFWGISKAWLRSLLNGSRKSPKYEFEYME